MKNFVALAAFAAGTNALVGRGDGCCFHITASGDASGQLGQLGDGQIRLGDNSLSPSQFCINSNGAITDNKGRGCIVTADTTQIQCDEGATATTGFSINSSGKLEYDGKSGFVACETGQNNGRNIYTTESDSVTQCKKVELAADKCSGNGSGAGGGGGSSPAVSSVPVAPSSAVPTGQPASSTPGTPGSAASSSVPVPGNNGHPGSASGPAPSAPANTAPLPDSPVTVVSTVTVNDCSCSTAGVPGGAAPGGPSGSGGVVPVPSGGAHPSGPASISQPSTPGGGGAQPSIPGGGGAQTSVPVGSSQPTGPASSPQLPNSSGMPAPSGPAGSSSIPSVPGGSGSSSHPTPLGSPKPSTMSSIPVSSASHSSSVSHSASASRSAASGCPTTLSGSHTSGNYEYPHLIVPVNSTSPDTAFGSGYFGTVSPSISSIFNFDIPSSDAGKTCSLVFLFPKKSDLETSSYEFSGNGKIDISKLSKAATDKTTRNNMPSVSQDLGQITISPGNSYLVSTFSCPAGEAVAYEMKDAGDTNLHFFQDYNPSP
ncbi:hypothetical protein N7492_004302 [Penicillium capsulatum]|uniref:Ubiquitin 3 binding protein But2 C-terminal domain-containing protein n=1 Tax=Penicillium capsulatum TaxID=69766 RepID=A0A9W9I9M0_9EURO|nr:hypothetical protein N7492_004302 [Penicillium capsulatum]KAJ6136579.1 hypothetical protein N7512_001739 [Penicillium capsulatum]